MCIILAINAAMGVFGNLWLIIAVLRYKKFHSSPYALLVCLAVANLLFCLVTLPGQAANIVYTALYDRPHPFYSGDSAGVLPVLIQLLYTWEPNAMVTLSINRYILIIHPQKYKDMFSRRRTALAIVLVYVLGVLFVLPAMVGGATMGYYSEYFVCSHVPQTSFWYNMSVSARSVMAMVAMVFCYAKLLAKVYRSKRNLARVGDLQAPTANQPGAVHVSKKEQSLSIQFAAICSIYIFSYGLFGADETYVEISGSGRVPLVSFLVVLAVSVNASINPAVYLVFNKDLRKHMMCRGCAD